MPGIRLVTDASVEPLSLHEVKEFLRIDAEDTTEDALLSALIKAARRHCEDYTRTCFISQTWDLWLDRFPASGKARDPWWSGARTGSIVDVFGGTGEIAVPRSPLLSITWLKTYSTAETESAFDLSLLNTDTASQPGRIFLKYGQVWPSDLRDINAINLRFTAGYGTSSASVPASILHACRLLVAHYYENREPVLEGRAVETPLAAQVLLNPYRVNRI